MESVETGYSVVRRGSFDDAAVSLRPHLRSLAQRRRSAPSLVFGKALGMSWSPIREEASCWVSVDQSPFVLGLASESGELLLDECVQVTEGSKTKERHLFLFKDVIVFAKLKSNSGYRLKNRVVLQDIWMYGFEDDPVDEEEPTEEIDLRVTLVLAWALTFCLVCFRSPEVKERWLETLHRKISQAKSMVGCVSQPPDVLMKVLSGSITPKTLSGGGMEDFIEIPLNGDAKLNNQEEKLLQTSETRWKLVRKLRKGSSFISRACRSDTDTKTQLFGQPLAKICPDNCSLPKPLTEILLLLRKKGPSTEGVFRKPCNIKNMRDIRERLNSGIEVDMDIQPVCLLVGLLKNFMKDIPGSLLVSELYIDWMKALDNEETQQRAREIRTVVDKLPGANKLLLQHLVCVLHHILEGADTNKMDAYNLAVCIAPTLLQSDCTPLEEQKDKVEKVTELTRFLIEHSELLGENIPNLLDTADDSVSSKHHDSEYDRTDPDGDGEAVVSASSTHGEGGSSSSLSPPSANASTWPADSIFNTKPGFNRRCSEPILLLSPDLQSLCSHTRSHEDCSVVRRDFEEQPLKKQISDESFLLRGQGGSRPITSFRKLSSSLNVDPLPYMIGNHTKDCSCSSLESAASNHSEGSLFTVSPTGSPACRRVNVTNKLSVAAKAQKEIAAPLPDEKRRSQTMRVTNKVLMRTRSVGAHSRSSLKKDSQRENSFPCETLREDCQNEAAEPLLKPRPLSAIEVFKLADSRLPCRPPSYEHAVQNTALPPQYRSMTVHDAIELERRSRPSSVNYDFPSSCSVNQCIDNFAQTAQEKGDIVQRRQPFRRRVMSETVSAGHCEAITRRCSQPVFEEFSYAKESYI